MSVLRLSTLALACCVAAVAGHASEPKKTDSAARASQMSNCLSMLESRGGKLSPLEMDPEAKQEVCACFLDRARSDEQVWATLESGERPESIQIIGAIFADLLGCVADSLRKQVARLSIPVERIGDAAAATAPGHSVVSRTGIARKEGRDCRIKEYPEFARQQSAEGLSVVHFEVDPSGRVSKLRIARSSGDTLGHKLLDLQAANVIWQCRFVPATRNGRPEAAWGSMEFEWKLR
jgi:TonB family protein